MPVCGSPGLIAACHVLHRLLLPRHPPCALSSLTIKFTQYTSFEAPELRSYEASQFGTRNCNRQILCSFSTLLLAVDSRRHTSRVSKALIKTYSALCFPKSIQLSKI